MDGISGEKRLATNLRTLHIIEIMGRSEHAMTATEINDTLGLPKQTVHRLCATLEKEGFLIREVNGKRYSPSVRLKKLATGILYSSRGDLARHQVLKSIASQIKETVNLVVPEDDGMMYLDRVEADWPLRIQLPVGSNVPFHCTASGKAFMATLSPIRRRSIVRNMELKQLTSNTYTDAELFLSELNRTSHQGYAIDNEEFIDGMVAVAVPIVDDNGRYCASLAFHAPAQRISIDKAISYREILTEGAERLAETLYS
ncbi:MAG: IclR family transcriptional regulator [Pseudomonadota bacterium]